MNTRPMCRGRETHKALNARTRPGVANISPAVIRNDVSQFNCPPRNLFAARSSKRAMCVARARVCKTGADCADACVMWCVCVCVCRQPMVCFRAGRYLIRRFINTAFAIDAASSLSLPSSRITLRPPLRVITHNKRGSRGALSPRFSAVIYGEPNYGDRGKKR